MSVDNIEEIREEFENWYLDNSGNTDIYLEREDGDYIYTCVDAVWRAYLAGYECPMKWHPIETAPKDGARILILDEHKRVCTCRFMRGDWLDGWENETFDMTVTMEHPTHWMPLPQPPENENTI